MHFTFLPFARFSPAPASLFSRSRLRGTQGARVYSTAQVWAPTGLSGAFSGRSKSRNLASNHGIGFRPARASQDNGNPHFSFLAPPSHARRTLDSSFPCSCSDGHYCACVDHYYACVDHYYASVSLAYDYVCCVCQTCEGVCMCAGLCICVLELHISAFFWLFSSARCCCTSHVCITPTLNFSSSLLCHSHRTTAVAHQVLPFVTATDGASVYVCVRALCFLWERANNLKRGARMLWRGQGDTNLHLVLRELKATTQPRLQQQ